MSNNIVLSVVIPVYNNEQFLIRCLDSLLDDTRQSFFIKMLKTGNSEVIFLNDHDNRIEEFNDIIDKYIKDHELEGLNIYKYVNEFNKGELGARTELMKYANGNYMCTIDLDDVFFNDIFEQVINDINTYHSDLYYYNFGIYNSNYYSSDLDNVPINEIVSKNSYFWPCVIKKEIYKKVYDIVIKYFDFSKDVYTVFSDLILNMLVINYSNTYKLCFNQVLLKHTDDNLCSINHMYKNAKDCNDINNKIDLFLNIYNKIKYMCTTENVDDWEYLIRKHFIHWISFFKFNFYDFLRNNESFIELEKIFNLNKPLISTCVLFYNQEKNIDECLMSICDAFKTKLDFIEINIVNDHSQDNTDQRIKTFIEKHKNVKINYINHQTNLGILQSRIDAINLSSGKYLTFIDGDDSILSNVEWLFNSNLLFLSLLTNELVDVLDTGTLLKNYIHDKNFNKRHIVINAFETNYDEFKNKFCNHSLDFVFFNIRLLGKLFNTRILKSIVPKLPKVYLNWSEDFLINMVLNDEISDKLSIYCDTNNKSSFYLYSNANVEDNETSATVEFYFNKCNYKGIEYELFVFNFLMNNIKHQTILNDVLKIVKHRMTLKLKTFETSDNMKKAFSYFKTPNDKKLLNCIMKDFIKK